ncbi:probable protein phosphatase 2C member 13, mitochondrial [Diospyros lotus]|uniref:probable protein phosphatase 2C member 13, mitochondrial n=1 Tax=Diospyros lotus TaxID=55363 RepID=UPI0022547A73|nr:probable protein phosphatase 2C member 13, mitochondrial [Diospyros lotus]
MVCGSCLRSLILRAGYVGRFTKDRVQLSYLGRSLNATWGRTYLSTRTFTKTVEMMVDAGSTASQGPIVDVLAEKDVDGAYISGGWKSEDGKLSCGYSSFRGKRVSMEDFFDFRTSKIDGRTVCMFGIFDGHGGSRAAEFLKEHLFQNLLKHSQFLTNTKLAISETYQQTDMDFLESEKDSYRDDGSTASTAVLVGSHLYVANVGDSRTVISKAGKAIPLSEDHKPNRSDERKRIESAGGVVMWAGTWRVGGVLAMSRAFGNRMLKQFVVAEPEIQDQELDEQYELLVLASDGLWDVVPNEDAVSLALTEEEPEAAARKLTETAYARGSADNITCIVVRFHHDQTDPTIPPNPTDQAVPPNPADQAVPANASNLAIPANPGDQAVPANPGDQAVPVNPADLAIPANPADPVVPVKSVDPAEAANPQDQK